MHLLLYAIFIYFTWVHISISPQFFVVAVIAPRSLQVGLVVSNVPNAPRYASFMADAEWKENVACRDMKPSLPNVLEVYRLAEEYKLQKVVPPVGRNSQAHKAKGLMCVLERSMWERPSTCCRPRGIPPRSSPVACQ